MEELIVIPPSTSQDIEKSIEAYFKPFEEQAAEWLEKAKAMKVTDASQVELIKESRVARLALRDARIGSENKRKDLKERSLREGQMIDKIAKRLKETFEPVEKALQENEDFVEIQEAKIKKELSDARYAQLFPLMGIEALKIQLGEIEESVFQSILNGQVLAKQQRDQQAIDAKKKADDEAAELIKLKEQNKTLQQTVTEKTEQVEGLKKNVATGNPFGVSINKTTDKALMKAWGLHILGLTPPPVVKDPAKKLVKDVQTLLTKINDHIIKKLDTL